MNHTISAAPRAGARESCVRTSPAGFRPVLRRTLLCAIRATRTDFGLSTGDVLVLDTLLSFLPCRERGTERPITPDTMLTIYAANATICARANGMDERVLRRHIARLVAAGLLARRDSATRKRFPLRSGGQVRAAYGLDLTPLLERHAEIAALAETRAAEAEEARAVRAEALAVRAVLLRGAARLTAEARDFVETAKTVLRRTTLSLGDMRAILARLMRLARGQAVMAEAPAPSPTAAPCPAADVADPQPEARTGAEDGSETDAESAANGEIVRPVESPKTETDMAHLPDRAALAATWATCPALSEYVPHPPDRPAELMQSVYMMGSFVGVKERPLAEAIATLGWLRVVTALDYLIANATRIARPDRYLGRMVTEFRAGKPVAGIR
ncbi:hypothetical protein ROJ8625_03194 [Roseivivax jejudonensis]|uniref:Plasmid replication protein C N-terminal domain-containing protein n=1 Tax=Roseivivax jejudonensis TaxID=1529041 RepID=A0A1X6ZVW5_9RHOB|nr:helix-turn-helix domain-containing protein [Roseivivax jejudonensis]SLN63365.1 hypothetical protein ROJ8625_03194 [Roseivivax jejudonensis]